MVDITSTKFNAIVKISHSFQWYISCFLFTITSATND